MLGSSCVPSDRGCCSDPRSIELAMRLQAPRLRDTLGCARYVLERSAEILHHHFPSRWLNPKPFKDPKCDSTASVFVNVSSFALLSRTGAWMA